MKRFAVTVLALGLLLFPSTVLARIGVIPVVQIVFDALGDTTGRRLSADSVLVTTVGLSGVGIVDCDGNQDCLRTGLNGKSLDILQDLRILIEFTSAGVTGRTRGEIKFPESNIVLPDTAKFRGAIEGQVNCLGGPGNRCRSAEVDIRVRARMVDPEQQSRVGNLELKLVGTLVSGGGDGTPPGWTSLEGNGRILISISDDA